MNYLDLSSDRFSDNFLHELMKNNAMKKPCGIKELPASVIKTYVHLLGHDCTEQPRSGYGFLKTRSNHQK